MTPLCILLGKTPILQLRLAFKRAGRALDPVLTPDYANEVVCVRIPGQLVLGDGHILPARDRRLCPAYVLKDRQRAGQSHRKMDEDNSQEAVFYCNAVGGTYDEEEAWASSRPPPQGGCRELGRVPGRR